MSSESIYPFLPSTAGSPPQVFPYDVVINDAYPGIQFIPTEPNGEYQEIREVTGSLWLVTNAQWNANLLQWDQEANQNTGLPAYALELGEDGSMTRWHSPATNIPSTPITWVPWYEIDANGQAISTPSTVTVPGAASQQVYVTWNAGIATQVQARVVNVTDISSQTESLLDNLVVNGTSKWAIDKSGTLITGIIPFARITGYTPPSFNNVTLTGTTTMTGPVVMDSTLDVFGAATMHSSLTADGTLFVVGLATLNGHANINSGETVTGGSHISGGLTVTGGETTDTLDVTGGLTVTGGETADTLHVTGGLTATGGENVTGGLTTDTLHVTGAAQIDGGVTGGLSVAGGLAVTGGETVDTLHVTGTSALDGAVTAGSTLHVVGTSTLANVTLGGADQITINGTTPVVQLVSSDGTIDVVQLSPHAYDLTVASGIVAVGGIAQNAVASTNGTVGGGNGPNTISLVLPGTGSMTYSVTVECTVGTGGAGSLTLTDTGGTFTGAPITWSVGNFASYIHMYDYGTAVGGTTITSVSSSTGTEFYRIQAIRTS